MQEQVIAEAVEVPIFLWVVPVIHTIIQARQDKSHQPIPHHKVIPVKLMLRHHNMPALGAYDTN
jgi:hypothetical protein